MFYGMLVKRWDGARAVMEALQEERDRADNARSVGVTVRSTMTSRGDYVVLRPDVN